MQQQQQPQAETGALRNEEDGKNKGTEINSMTSVRFSVQDAAGNPFRNKTENFVTTTSNDVSEDDAFYTKYEENVTETIRILDERCNDQQQRPGLCLSVPFQQTVLYWLVPLKRRRRTTTTTILKRFQETRLLLFLRRTIFQLIREAEKIRKRYSQSYIDTMINPPFLSSPRKSLNSSLLWRIKNPRKERTTTLWK
jgi:hypothetical protein